MPSLKEKMLLKGISASSVHRATRVFKADISKFINGRISRCSKKSRKVLKEYFISIGLLPQPKPRKAPACRSCGALYPTRKLRVKFDLPVEVLIDAEKNPPLLGKQDTMDNTRNQ